MVLNGGVYICIYCSSGAVAVDKLRKSVIGMRRGTIKEFSEMPNRSLRIG